MMNIVKRKVNQFLCKNKSCGNACIVSLPAKKNHNGQKCIISGQKLILVKVREKTN